MGRCSKISKTFTVKNVSTSTLTYDELETIIIHIEAILNSRPLTPMSADPNDLSALTPGHFLIGEPLTATSSKEASDKTSLVSKCDSLKALKYNFWDRWSKEYRTNCNIGTNGQRLYAMFRRLPWLSLMRTTCHVCNGQSVE